VDLWDFMKVLVRRWYLTAPLLIAVGAAAVVAGKGVEPTYTASADGVFLEPVTNLAPELLSPNPWLQAGVSTTASAVLGSVVNPNAKGQVVADGFSGDYSIQMAARTVLFTLYASAPTPDEAVATLDHVVQLMRDDLSEKQTQYNVPTPQQILIQLSSGTSLVSTREGLSQVLAVVGGLGLVGSVAIVLTVDALMVRRARRLQRVRRGRRDDADADADADAEDDAQDEPKPAHPRK